MSTYINQVLGGTRLDSQGERLPLDVLESICDKFSGRKFPLHQKHNIAEHPLGHIENLHIAPDKNNPREWLLLGDVYVTQGVLNEALKGFSISFTQPLREVDDPDFLLYIPFPHYNNQTLVADLSTDPKLKIGKWIKKEADPSTYAFFGAAAALLLGPIWDDIYKRKIAPKIDRFLDTHLSRIQQANIKLEHAQLLIYESHQIELRFIPALGKERYCFSANLLNDGISCVAAHLEQDDRAKSPGVERIVLRYDTGSRSYGILRVEYKDGEVVHHA